MTKKIFWLLFWLCLLFTLSFVLACGEWGKDNWFGGCVCKDWYTKVNWVCTPCDWDKVCCGVKLNTNIPFVWNCITLSKQDPSAEYDVVTEANAFPTLIAWLTKLLMTVILIVCFLVVIVAWVLWTTWDSKKGKELIKWVAIALALLGASGVILRLVNPNFFG